MRALKHNAMQDHDVCIVEGEREGEREREGEGEKEGKKGGEGE